MSPSRTGPLTFRTMVRFRSSRNSTRTWVTLPVLPVRPRTRFTLASLTGWSMFLDVFGVMRLLVLLFVVPWRRGGAGRDGASRVDEIEWMEEEELQVGTGLLGKWLWPVGPGAVGGGMRVGDRRRDF